MSLYKKNKKIIKSKMLLLHPPNPENPRKKERKKIPGGKPQNKLLQKFHHFLSLITTI